MRRRPLIAAALLAAVGPARAQSAPVWEPDEVAAGVYRLQGLPGEPDARNRGRTGNAGFVVGRSGVALVDSGCSWLEGEAILAAVARVTDKPVRLALLTHARQEFVFGGAALQARGIPVHMSRAAADLMAARCERCLHQLQRDLGEDLMRGTRMFRPDVMFDETHVLESIGRPLFVQPHGHASSPGDSTVLDVRSGCVFAGGLVDHRRIPDLRDADIDGWRQALAVLRTLPKLDTLLPGHGPAAGPEVLGQVERYLVRLQERVAALLKANTGFGAVPDAAAMPEYAAWDGYPAQHRRNASHLFLRLELALMLEPLPGSR